MVNKFWNDDKVAALTALAAKGLTYNEIAVSMNHGVHGIINKLHSLGLSARRKTNPAKRVMLDQMPAVRFSDIANPDRDRWVGRAPQREYGGSLTGCAGQMCVGEVGQ